MAMSYSDVIVRGGFFRSFNAYIWTLQLATRIYKEIFRHMQRKYGREH